MKTFQSGERVHLIDKKERPYAVTLKAGEIFQHSGDRISHDDIIGKPDGTVVQFSNGKLMVAVHPTLAEYTLKMPRGAQVIYPKDLAVIPMWADIYPGARVFEAGVGSGALTMALLRAVGDRGCVVSYEMREDFAATATKNIERFMGKVPNHFLQIRNAYEGIEIGEGASSWMFDRVVLDIPEPWRVVPHAARALRSGGLYLSYVPTVPQVMQTVQALEQSRVFTMVQNFETLLRTWNIKGRSVRPDHRMVAHSGFITVARKVENHNWNSEQYNAIEPASQQDDHVIKEDEYVGDGLDIP
ncbi:tRNA (adenine-N1)-methyltransferase [Candidatus Nitrospira allomarina]|uniref:tRNA (adenine(58)-N(1))-methyltransferase TrmI n=1 Tax=Candidatus Nitrospira allomarina TaxID=3020900 RepID=A0AA96JYM8_9BACT|nr:tRNA (adenine-N1)-methyltransferase [Candidatus Nitrospira allomarina]WNM57764.1 tRNA (adenine-N1)-methyltransferase [Candidatus Nitrospira allomarina]